MSAQKITKRLRVFGVVQGVGFRPTVARYARAGHVVGTVCNKGPYVEIIAQGDETQVDAFFTAVQTRPPERATILKGTVTVIEDAPDYQGFQIVESEKKTGEIYISPDIAICDTCKKELFNPTNRRYLHPFINCTNCGPRLTILDALPYDRARTSMKDFPMCPSCDTEYHNPHSRRYDAQPVCCNDCGPQVYLLSEKSDEKITGREAITAARQMIYDGGIIAVKGIGGFHLCCDATNEQAVLRLRAKKHRPAKPFAVMMKDKKTAERECVIGEAQKTILTGHQKPIILLSKKTGGKLCASVAPDNLNVGVMLPYAPIQCLLFEYDDGITMPDCFVMTSGNTSGAPICHNDAEALTELGGICDLILSNDRPIRTRADDSVLDFVTTDGETAPYMIRRSRGYAPLPVMVSASFEHNVLAVGGELKNTFCINRKDLFYPSAYVGDLADVRTVKALRETIARMETLLEVTPEAVACDLHPRYQSTMVAKETGLPLVPVQHHYAHIVSCMAENDVAEPAIGLSYDGTGYGTDGTIWGGEILTADYHGFERVGHLRPFLQIGGDKSSKEGWRIAVSMINAWCDMPDDVIQKLQLCDEKNARVQRTLFDKQLGAVQSTSMGRLFDAVSAILNIKKTSTFEGEASMVLEFAAECYEKRVDKKAMNHMIRDLIAQQTEMPESIIDEAVILNALIDRQLRGEDAEASAYLFHAWLAVVSAQCCEAVRTKNGINTVALSGGVFQNKLLLRLTEEQLKQKDFCVLRHRLIPPNDGGIALGQAVAAAQWLMDNK